MVAKLHGIFTARNSLLLVAIVGLTWRLGENLNLDTPAPRRLSHERQLLQNLTQYYDPNSRPVRRAGTKIRVNVTVQLLRTLDLVEKNQILITQLNINQQWFDELLTWDPEEFGGLDHFIFPSNKIWLPDIYIFNNAIDGLDGYIYANKSRIFGLPSGHVSWSVPLIVKSACAVDVLYFPFDNQLCHVQFGSWLYEESEVDIWPAGAGGLDMSSYEKNNEFTLLHTSLQRRSLRAEEFDQMYYTHTEYFSKNENSRYPQLVMTLHMRRRPLYYLYTIVAPTLVLCFMMLFTFFLPCSSGDKVGIGLTVFLSLYVLQLSIAENIPESNSLPLISLFLLLVMTLNSLSLMFSTLVINLKKQGTTKPCPPVPTTLLALCQNVLSRITCTRKLQFVDFYAMCADEERILRRHSQTKNEETERVEESNVDVPQNHSQASLLSLRSRYGSRGDVHSEANAAFDDVKPQQNELLAPPTSENERRPSRFASNTSKRFMNHRNMKLEWYFVAEVMDKFLFLLFLIAMTVTIVMSLVVIPELHKNDKWE